MNSDDRRSCTRHSAIQSVGITSSATAVVGTSPRRTGLIFTPEISGVAYAVSNSADVTKTTGLTVLASSGPLQLTAAEHGDIVKQAWYAVSNSITVTITVLETIGE